MATKIKLTKLAVDRLPYSQQGKQIEFYDSDLPAFGIRVGASTKVYFVRKRIGCKSTRVSLGRHGVITADQARKDAQNALSDITRGIDLNLEKAKNREKGITLQLVYEEYLAAKPQMKSSTLTSDKSLLSCHLGDWMKKPLKDITEKMIQQKHLQIAKNSGENTANNAMRLFRRIFLFAWRSQKKSGLLDRDLVKDAMDGRWFKVGRRKTVIREHDLAVWHKALQKVSNPVIQDFLLLLLLTGLRENEGLTLEWKDVDMTGKTFTIRKEHSKNKEAHTLPMSDAVFEIFKRRMDLRENVFVFPGNGKTGHLTETKRQLTLIERESQRLLNGLETIKELENLPAENRIAGVKFCLHDLRRTFISIAEGVVSYSELKRLVNHSDKDVTQGYIVKSVEQLRQPMQQVTNVIKRYLEPRSATIIPILEGKRKATVG